MPQTARHQTWMEDAQCRGVDYKLFFPTSPRKDEHGVIEKYCSQCPVREQCLDYALKRPEPWGIWGGMTQYERRLLAVFSGAQWRDS